MKYILQLVFCFLSIFGNSQNGDNLTTQLGTKERAESILQSMLTLHQQAYFEEIDETTKEKIESEIRSWQQIMIDSIAEIYDSSFTIEEMTALADFYSNEIGREIAEKQALIFNQGFELEKKWALGIQEKVASILFRSDSLYFLKDIDGCEFFHEGEFVGELNGIDYLILRKNGIQTEVGKGNEYQYKINWLSNCKFELIPISESITIPSILDNVIYEIEGSSYMVLTKERGKEFYFKGKATKK